MSLLVTTTTSESSAQLGTNKLCQGVLVEAADSKDSHIPIKTLQGGDV